MKISARTKQILKVFAGINQNVLLIKGNKIRTLSASKTVYAEADVEETFPEQFGIYDLNEFLGVLSLFDDPDVQFETNSATISSGKNAVRYLPADESVLVAPKKPLVIADPITTFELASESITSAIKAAGVLKAPYITFRGDGKSISLIAHDKTNVNSNNFSVEVADSDVEFEYHVKTEYLTKLLAEKFEVLILPKNLIVFRGDAKLYLIAADSDSK